MTQASTFKEAIDNKRFLEAEDMIKRGEDILKSQFQFKLSDAYPKIIQNNAYHVLDSLIEHDHIELDIFEYDSFSDSIFQAIATYAEDTDEAATFIESFVPQVESLNDSLGDDTWLGLCLHMGMPIRLFKTMIDQGCDVHYLDRVDATLLHRAVAGGYHRLTQELRIDYIKLLIEHGVDVNRQDLSGSTPLHGAVGMGFKEIVRELLEQGADPNVPTKVSSSNPGDQGMTAYHIAVLNNGDMDMVNLLSEYVPVDFYVETPRKTTLLFDYLSTFYSTFFSDRDKQFLQFFADNGADVYRPNEDHYGQEKTVADILVEKNFDFFDAFTEIFDLDVTRADDQGNTLLHKVCAYNVNFEEAKAKDVYRKVKKLIKMGADVSLTNTADKTAMDLASTDNLKEKTVALLLKQQ